MYKTPILEKNSKYYELDLGEEEFINFNNIVKSSHSYILTWFII